MPHKLQNLFFIACLSLFITACQSLSEVNIFADSQDAEGNPPVSNFVDAREHLQAKVGQPLAIASYHRGEDKLTALETSINGQPLRSEATAGQPNTFPDPLASAQVLVWRQPAQTNLQPLNFPSATCQNLLTAGGPVQSYSLVLSPPSSVWTVCHVWVGQLPGTYDLSLVAVDEAGRKGEPIVQRIEVQ